MPAPVTPYMELRRSVREGGDQDAGVSTDAGAPRSVHRRNAVAAGAAGGRAVSGGEAWQDSGLVFTTRNGTEMDAANVRRELRRALRYVPGIDPAE